MGTGICSYYFRKLPYRWEMVTPAKNKQTRRPLTAAYPKYRSSTITYPVSVIHFHKICANAVRKIKTIFLRQQYFHVTADQLLTKKNCLTYDLWMRNAQIIYLFSICLPLKIPIWYCYELCKFGFGFVLDLLKFI